MPHASAEAARESKRRYYERNTAQVKARAKQRQDERRAWLASLKAGRPCTCCGWVFPPVVMDWHHRDPSTKDPNLQWLGASKERVLAEIAKCDLYCANCHRLEHYDTDGEYIARKGYEKIKPLVSPS